MRVRRNLIPNPVPVGLGGWNHSEYLSSLEEFENLGGIHYKATATDAGCQTGIESVAAIPIRSGERYGISVDVDVVTVPEIGILHFAMFWSVEAGGEILETWFSSEILVGFNELKEVSTAPEGAKFVRFGLIYQTLPSVDPDTTTPVEWTASRFLCEPLGPPLIPDEDAITNMVVNPSLRGTTKPWVPHTYQSDQILGDTVWELQDGWATSGEQSLRQTIVAGDEILPGTNFYGFIGAYVATIPGMSPGDRFRYQCDVMVLECPPTGPGVFLEIFFYYYDGDPANTVMLQHINSDTIYTPVEIGVTKTLECTAVCPDGANTVQVLTVIASGEPGATLDFYSDSAILTKNQPILEYFDGDMVGAGWDGIPGNSYSRSPGKSQRIQGDWFCGNDHAAQWEGEENNSMSTLNPHLMSTPSAHTPENVAVSKKSMK
jgi:hypothetical protein